MRKITDGQTDNNDIVSVAYFTFLTLTHACTTLSKKNRMFCYNLMTVSIHILEIFVRISAVISHWQLAQKSETGSAKMAGCVCIQCLYTDHCCSSGCNPTAHRDDRVCRLGRTSYHRKRQK